MIFFILSDAPFNSEVKLSNYTMSSCSQNTETDIKKVGNTVVATWIRGDGSQYEGNWIVMSFDGGNTWSPIYFSSSDPNCWIGDPAIAIQPDNPNIIYSSGMIYCNPNNTKGEVYFCRCTAGSNCTNSNNWFCGIVGPNDNWAYFKDKPWLLALGNNTVLVNFTTDKFIGNYNLVIYKSTDNGQTWQQVGYTNWPSTVGYWAKDGNNIYMSYNDFSQANNGIIFVGFLRSQDNGNTFSDIAWTGFNFGSTTFCPNYQRAAKIHDNITASSGNVAIAFVDGNCKARVGVWTGSGNSLTVYQIAPSGGGSQQVLPMLVSSGSKIFAQWQGRISSVGSCGGFTIGTWATYWSYSTNWGQTWSSPSRVSSADFYFSENPLGHDYNGWIIDNGKIYTTWANDYRDNQTGDTYYSWTSAVNLEEISNSKPKIIIKYQNNKIFINSDESFSIYKLNGTLVNSYNKGSYEISLKPGIYFVKSNNFSDKFIIR